MEKIFGIDFGNIFGGKDDEMALDKNTLQSVSQATVHTMKDDLTGNIAELSSAHTVLKPNIEPSEKSSPMSPAPIQSEQKKQANPFIEKQSPFPSLNQIPKEREIKNSPLPASSQTKPPIEIRTPTPSKPIQTPEPIKERIVSPVITPKETKVKASKFNFGKALIFFFAFILVVLLAGGGYYFWINQQRPAPPIEISTPIIPTPDSSSPITQTPQIPLPKYLNIDFQNSTGAQVIDVVKKHLSESTFSPDGTPIEFVISDLQNNPIAFADFSSKIGLKLPTEIQNKLSEPFRFFASSYNENIGIGIIATSKDDTALKTTLLSEEKNLITYFKPVLFTKTFGALNTKSVTFSDNNYKDINVRYYNILSQDELSFDYTVFENKFIFGTTMMTLRSIFNYLEEEKTSQPNIGTVLPPPATSSPSPDDVKLP